MKSVIDQAAPLGRLFRDRGYRIYLVGGIVRDMLAGRELDYADLDFTTDATPQETKAIVGPWAASVWTQGERFGTIGCARDGRTFEITTHRAEAYRPDSRKPDVEFSTSIETDLSRRDFTVNAMALDLTDDDPKLIDPFGGADDLIRKRLATPLDAVVSFSDDPLRMMRAARFISGYGLVPTPELTAAVVELVERLSIVSVERIRAELDKLMVTDDPSLGIWFLTDTGLAQVFLPELPALRVEQDPIHRHKDVLTHTIAVVSKTRPDLRLRLAALFHDIGKPKTRAIGPGGVSFHHHEVVGARMTRDRMRALRYSKEMVADVSQLVFLHLRFHTYRMGWTDSAVRRFVRDAGDQLADLIELTRCDCTTRNKRKAEMLAQRMDELEARIADLAAQEELAAMRPDIDGQQVMAHLGLPPGPLVGRALRFLLEQRIEEGPLGEEEAFRRLDEWYAAQPDAAS